MVHTGENIMDDDKICRIDLTIIKSLTIQKSLIEVNIENLEKELLRITERIKKLEKK